MYHVGHKGYVVCANEFAPSGSRMTEKRDWSKGVLRATLSAGGLGPGEERRIIVVMQDDRAVIVLFDTHTVVGHVAVSFHRCNTVPHISYRFGPCLTHHRTHQCIDSSVRLSVVPALSWPNLISQE